MKASSTRSFSLNAMKQYLIGIDIGTSGTKSVLFDTLGNKVAEATAEYPMAQPQNGWAEQDPRDWWEGAKATLSAVSASAAEGEIVGIGLSGQMHSLVLLDENNEVIRPAILWCDGRTAKECEEIEAMLGRDRLVEITANPALTGFTASKLLWVKKHEPKNFEKTAHILLAKDYIRYKLTGEYATEVSDASGMQLLDVPRRAWSAEVCNALGIDMAKLPRVYESAECTGHVSACAAAETGLPAGLPVTGHAAPEEHLPDRCRRGSRDMHPEGLPDRVGLLRVHHDPPVRVRFGTDRQRPEGREALLRGLSDPARHLLPQVRAVVFRQAFQQGLQQDPFRAVRDGFLRVHKLHAGLPEPDLLDSYIFAGSAEAVHLPHDHRVEAPALRVVHHPAELIPAFQAGPGDMPVRVYFYNIDPVLRSVGPAVCDLAFYGLVRLAGPFAVAGIDHALHALIPNTARTAACRSGFAFLYARISRTSSNSVRVSFGMSKAVA